MARYGPNVRKLYVHTQYARATRMARIVRVLVLLALVDLAWHLGERHGYMSAVDNLRNAWYEGPEGYCLAEDHAGPCHD